MHKRLEIMPSLIIKPKTIDNIYISHPYNSLFDVYLLYDYKHKSYGKSAVIKHSIGKHIGGMRLGKSSITIYNSISRDTANYYTPYYYCEADGNGYFVFSIKNAMPSIRAVISANIEAYNKTYGRANSEAGGNQHFSYINSGNFVIIHPELRLLASYLSEPNAINLLSKLTTISIDDIPVRAQEPYSNKNNMILTLIAGITYAYIYVAYVHMAYGSKQTNIRDMEEELYEILMRSALTYSVRTSINKFQFSNWERGIDLIVHLDLLSLYDLISQSDSNNTFAYNDNSVLTLDNICDGALGLPADSVLDNPLWFITGISITEQAIFSSYRISETVSAILSDFEATYDFKKISHNLISLYRQFTKRYITHPMNKIHNRITIKLTAKTKEIDTKTTTRVLKRQDLFSSLTYELINAYASVQQDIIKSLIAKQQDVISKTLAFLGYSKIYDSNMENIDAKHRITRIKELGQITLKIKSVNGGNIYISIGDIKDYEIYYNDNTEVIALVLRNPTAIYPFPFLFINKRRLCHFG